MWSAPLRPICRPVAVVLAMIFASAAGPASAQALTPAFTFQGELRLSSGPATGSYDMQFRLYGAMTGGAQIGPTLTASNIAVSDGLFSVPLDFGAAQFAGERQWLEVRIRPAGSGSFETLSPRTEVTAAPYAWSAAVALANSVTTTSIVDGTIGSADINPAQVQRRVNTACQAFEAVRAINEDGTLTCNEIGTGSVTLVQTGIGLTGGPITTSGTISVAPGGIGTVELADGGIKAIDVDPAQVQRRVIGTCGPGQYVQAIGPEGTVDCGTDATGPAGWTLSGNASTNPASNFIGTTDAQPFVVRTANARSLRLSPSSQLLGTTGIPITASLVAGSAANTLLDGARGATISGGGTYEGGDPAYPTIGPNAITDAYGSVGGGASNLAGNDDLSLINASFATVGGGVNNRASNFGSTVAGGQINIASGFSSVVGGGVSNTASGERSTIGGGFGNVASGSDSTVGAGDSNNASGPLSTVGGGYRNVASGNRSALGGGYQNTASGFNSTVGGGFGNTASGGYSTVGGGYQNTTSGDDSTVGGGDSNTASGGASTVGGGLLNIASGFMSTVGGGSSNCAGGDYSWAGGRRARVRPASDPASGSCSGLTYPGGNGDQGTFVWADSQVANFVSTGTNQFLVRANGGFGFNTNTIPAGIEAVFQSRGGANQNVDLYLRPATHGRGINLAMLPDPAGPAAFYISQYDGTTFVDRILLESNGDFRVTAQAFKPGGGSWAVPSDARLKSEVAPLSGALDRLLALRPVEFTYRPEVTPKSLYLPGRQVGLIAQEVEQVFPEWVSVSNEGWKTVGPRGFEALTVEALRELRAESALIDGAQSLRLAALETENARLRDESRTLSAESADLRAGQRRLSAENSGLRERLERLELLLGARTDEGR